MFRRAPGLEDAAARISQRIAEAEQQQARHAAVTANAREAGVSADGAAQLAREAARLRFCLANLQRWELVLAKARLPEREAAKVAVAWAGEPGAMHELAMAQGSAYGGYEGALERFPRGGDLKLVHKPVHDARPGGA